MSVRLIPRTMLAVSLLASTSLAATPEQTAARVDELLLEEISGLSSAAAARTDDTTFLRRVSLDLIGELPTPEEIAAFTLDRSADKRSRAVDRLLASPHYGQNWARYWRDVILYRRSDDRALALSATSVTVYLTEQFNRGAGWDEIAREMITAEGDARQHGATALIMAQEAKAEETAAEMSRVFLGIQIQCAQCHDHPYDSWSREQFHELAAFFPRTSIRPLQSVLKRSFEITSIDNRQQGRRGRGNGEREHHMPDLDDPKATGTLMRPVFFVTGKQLDTGVSDAVRREALALWMTEPDNPWFAKALVNRLWSELVGTGFHEPVDDIGPERKSAAPRTLEHLATQFVSSGHDLKWLFRTLAATEAYQRESRPRVAEGETPFASNHPQPLRADQLFNAVSSALVVDPEQQQRRGNRDGRYRQGGPRAAFNRMFGYDPSLARDEVSASIPQALFMMNSPLLATQINGRDRRTMLGRLLADETDDEMVTVDLYLNCLAREPSENELKTCLDHVRQSGERTEAFEDILWSLLNSAEFRFRN